MSRRRSAELMLLLASGLAALSTGANASAFDQMFVFGDSGSDSGNAAALTQVGPGTSFFPPAQPSGVLNPAGVPYNYRFSNGPVAAEYLSGLVGAGPSLPAWPKAPANGHSNFAVGGGMTGPGPAQYGALCCNYNFLVDSPNGLSGNFPDLQFTGLNNQVELFKSRLDSGDLAFEPATSLFFVQGGYNDIFLALALAASLPAAEGQALLQAYTVNAALNMGSRIGELATLGAENFFVVNIFDLARMPFVIEAGQEVLGTALTGLFNNVLDLTVDQLRTNFALDIIEFDAVAALDHTIASGVFSNTTEPCFDANDVNGSLPKVYGGCQGYLFFDGAHPTTAAARMSALAMAAQIPEPRTNALAVLGLALIGWIGRRRCANVLTTRSG